MHDTEFKPTNVTKFTDWVKENPVKEEMIWKGAAEHQLTEFAGLAEELDAVLYVISYHNSKSIKLPVIALQFNNGWLILRNNFYDICIGMIWNHIPDLKLSEVATPMPWATYLEAMSKNKGYTYKHWTEEEINDPRILRVFVERENGNGYWSKVSGETKDRWLNRMKSPEWMQYDWGRSRIVVEGSKDNTFDPTTEPSFYVLGYGFCEGFDRGGVPYQVMESWEPGKTMGHFSVGSIEEAIKLCKLIRDS